MAVPSIPADVSASASISSSHMNSVLDHVAWWHGNAGGSGARPLFKGQAWNGTSGAGQDIEVATGTNTTFGWGNATAFYFTPNINVASFTTQGSDADPESLVVPEAGIYRFDISCDYEANATGRRRCNLMVNGSAAVAAVFNIEAASASTTTVTGSGVVDLAASDQIDLVLHQNSGSTLQATAHLTLMWVQST